MTSNNSAWLPEGISPGKPARDPEWEQRRHKLLDIIHKLINAELLPAEVKECALAVNRNLPEPFTDSDVNSMCGWSERKHRRK